MRDLNENEGPRGAEDMSYSPGPGVFCCRIRVYRIPIDGPTLPLEDPREVSLEISARAPRSLLPRSFSPKAYVPGPPRQLQSKRVVNGLFKSLARPLCIVGCGDEGSVAVTALLISYLPGPSPRVRKGFACLKLSTPQECAESLI